MKIPFWKYIRQHKKTLVLALVLATINQVFSLLDPQIFAMIVDNYATKASSLTPEVFLQGVLLLLGASVGVAFVSRVAKNFQDYYVSVITQKVGTSMYSTSVEHTLSLPFSVFEDQRSGELLQKLQKAKTQSQELITNLINVLFLSLIGMIFVIGYALTVNVLVGIAYFMLIPVLGISTFFLSGKIKKAQKDIVIQSAELAGSTTETLRNVELVKSLGLEQQEIDRLNNTNDKILQLELTKIKLIRALSFVQGTLVNALRAGLLLLMLWLISLGQISLGQFFSLFIYSFFIFTPLAQFSSVASSYQEAKATNEQLEEILKMEPKPKPKNAIVLGALKTIEFNNVSFTYSSADVASAKNVSLTINAGETIAFAGPSGSGKSTLVKLLVGLYEPVSGKILFNGIDSKQIDFEELRKRIGLVSQDTQLFAGAIRENLLFVNPKASDDDCLKVLEMASVSNIIERGGRGLDTKIGEGGIKLSGGEKQRLAIARALLRNPDLIIFDEATSSLDSVTEKSIIETIKNITIAKPNLMIVMVAHRLSTIAHAKKIFVLEKGTIAEQGTHEQLLKLKGLYSLFWREQSTNSNSIAIEKETIRKK